MLHRVSRRTVALRELPVLRIVRRGDRHTVHDLSVDVQLELDDPSEDDAPEPAAVARAVQALAALHAGGEPETFASMIAQHGLTRFENVRRSHVEVCAVAWQRLDIGGRPRDRDLVRATRERRIACATADRDATRIAAGFREMLLMTADTSQLHPLLVLRLDAIWTYGWTEIPFDTQWQQVRRALSEAYVEREHGVGAQLAHALGRAVLDESPAVHHVEVRLETTRRDAVDMTAFGLENLGEVFAGLDAARGVYDIRIDREEIVG